MKDKHLADLFTAEEVEMLVCGSKVSGGIKQNKGNINKIKGH